MVNSLLEAEGSDREMQEMLADFRAEAQKREEETLSPGSSLSRDHSRHEGPEEDHRLPYKRDVDRIVHSNAYARYIDKTQVAYLVDHDHITHRALHVQLVSNFARGIAEILRLNGDLVEAIALGHDVGHPPFGHEGEEYLSHLSFEYQSKPFAHSYQSCRLLREIEPLNLGLAVYDGFLCHDGGLRQTHAEPRVGKTWADHFADLQQRIKAPEENIWPGTLEGCLVKLADKASYVGRDIEDAIKLGIISREDVPKTLLGTHNREILRALAKDIIRSSYGKPYIALSQEVFDALKALRSFNFERICIHPKLKVESKKIERAYRILFELLLKDDEEMGSKSVLAEHFLKSRSSRYLHNSTRIEQVVDYIAGMTDNYFLKILNSLVVPRQIEL